MRRALVFLYGLVAYVVFLGTFLYAIGFVSNLAVPRSIDSGIDAQLGAALAINALLLGLFGLQHSVMARPGFKRWWTKIVPQPMERSTFVLLTCVALGLMFWQWRTPAGVVWEVHHPALEIALWSLSGFGWIVVLLSTFIIDHFDLFGLRHVYLYAAGRDYRPPMFKESSFYRYVRHPLLLGFMIAFWATPLMTVSHLIFASIATAYMLVAIQLEERDLSKLHPSEYGDYRRRVPMLIPFLRFPFGSRKVARYIGDRAGESIASGNLSENRPGFDRL